jgi:hypothetical protein
MYHRACQAVDDGDFEDAVAFMQPIRKIKDIGYGFTVEDGAVLFNGEAIRNLVCDRILEAVGEEKPVTHLARFLFKLRQNPSHNAQQDLYRFLEVNKLPILDNGNFLAYKLVREDWKDVYSGRIDNSIGQSPSMPRHDVDDDRHSTCSRGLHVCGFEYLKSYCGQRLVAVEVNPKDVVSVPVDYNNTKMRVCDYYVREELDISIVRGDADFLSDNRSQYLEGNEESIFTTDDDRYDEGYSDGSSDYFAGRYDPRDIDNGDYIAGYEDGYDDAADGSNGF